MLKISYSALHNIALVSSCCIFGALCQGLTTLSAVRVKDGLELEVTDPKEHKGDVEQEEGQSEKTDSNNGGHRRGLGIQDCGGRQENSLRTVHSISQVLYTNTGWSVRSLG